jgi:DNA-binding XRE family transcriptional regulator
MKTPSGTTPEEVAQRLQVLRLALGYASQIAMVKFLGNPITTQQWNNWERGRSQPDLMRARIIARKTGATVDWIYWNERAGLPFHLVEKLDKVERDGGGKANRA